MWKVSACPLFIILQVFLIWIHLVFWSWHISTHQIHSKGLKDLFNRSEKESWRWCAKNRGENHNKSTPWLQTGGGGQCTLTSRILPSDDCRTRTAANFSSSWWGTPIWDSSLRLFKGSSLYLRPASVDSAVNSFMDLSRRLNSVLGLRLRCMLEPKAFKYILCRSLSSSADLLDITRRCTTS